MTPRDFVYWIQGFLEIQNPDKINAEQVQIIKEHIRLVLTKETLDFTYKFPNYTDEYPIEVSECSISC